MEGLMEKESVVDVGQIVHLKSGSPDLEVIGIVEKAVMVEWFDGEKMQHDIFPATSLSVA